MAEKYFQCTECQFSCKGASDFANHLVVHSVEQRHGKNSGGGGGGSGGAQKTPFGDLPPMRSDHPDLRRGCPFHEGACDNPAVCDFLAKERREQQEQAMHGCGGDKRNGGGQHVMSGSSIGSGGSDKVMTDMNSMDDDDDSDKNWEPMQPMKTGYSSSLDCKICGSPFVDRKELKKHMMIHSGEKPYQCHLCGKSFASATAMNKHITNHNQNKPYKCTKCNRAFSTQQKLEKHLTLHEGNRADCFMCTTCSVPFTRYSNLMRHCLAQNHPAPVVNRDKGKRPKEMGMMTFGGGGEGAPEMREAMNVSPAASLGARADNTGGVSMIGEENQLLLLSKDKKRDCQKWTEMEDNWLVSGVREFGKGQWKQILEKYREYFQEGRNRFTLRLRYAYLMKTGRIEMAPAIVTTVPTNGEDISGIPKGNPVAGITGEIHEKLMVAAN